MMPTVLLILEFLGTTELMVIAVVALIIFGPRRLPEIGRTVGKSIAEFKRASDDFKRTWEYEVELEQRRPALDAPQSTGAGLDAVAAVEPSALNASGAGDEEFDARAYGHDIGGETIARDSSYPRDDEPAEPETAGRDGGKEEDEVNAS